VKLAAEALKAEGKEADLEDLEADLHGWCGGATSTELELKDGLAWIGITEKSTWEDGING
jgi:hypothetical protein